MKFETKAIHEGQKPEQLTGAVNVPVYFTSTYLQDGIGRQRGFEYSRTGNPTRQALEELIASLEGSQYGLAFASGLAASDAVLRIFKAGDHIIAGDDIYGGSYRLFEKVYKKWGLEVTYADVTDTEEFKKAIKPNTRLIWVETPTNPLIKLTDISALSSIARDRNILLAVDNTFATPYFQQPLKLGADIVVHSTTKYLSGHSDVIGGAVVTKEKDIYDEIKFFQNAAGAVPGPMDSFLVMRGIKTLAVRMKEHERNARLLAEYLNTHKNVEKVHYPGLTSHPQHELALKQMKGFGGMISIELKGGFRSVEKFLSKLNLFIFAESLGGVESLVCYPSKMTHGSLPDEERKKRGINDNLIRLSVGIEHYEDLRRDLDAALDF